LKGVGTIRFNFPFTQQQKRRPPDPSAILYESYLEHWLYWSDRLENLACGGKSMGARIAVELSRDYPLGPLVIFSYPLIPAGCKTAPEKRITPLLETTSPTLIIQGEMDPMGGVEAFEHSLMMPEHISMIWCQDANHDLMARGALSELNDQQWIMFCDLISAWL
jgi:predicted alpha/beta-hydrolase family hydrolase